MCKCCYGAGGHSSPGNCTNRPIYASCSFWRTESCLGHLGPHPCGPLIFAWCRPLSDREIADRVPQVITCNEALREVTLFQSAGGKAMSRTFRFDKVFGQDSTQEKLFKQAVVPIVGEVMDGFNCTIFAYGQTGTGKTYTMEGGPRESDDGKKLSAQAGVIPRAIKQIFDTIESNNSDSTVKVDMTELFPAALRCDQDVGPPPTGVIP